MPQRRSAAGRNERRYCRRGDSGTSSNTLYARSDCAPGQSSTISSFTAGSTTALPIRHEWFAVRLYPSAE